MTGHKMRVWVITEEDQAWLHPHCNCGWSGDSLLDGRVYLADRQFQSHLAAAHCQGEQQ